jgi:hypothetical protein
MTKCQLKPRKVSEKRRAYLVRHLSIPENQLKLRARQLIAYAIKTGTISSLPCEDCGLSKSEAHHEDYSKPFEVIWLCRPCHLAKHRKSHCRRGHAMTDDNVLFRSGRRCLTCYRDQHRKYKQLKSERKRQQFMQTSGATQ